MSNEPSMNPNWTPPPGRSSGSKIWLGLGIGCGVLVLLCCGGVVFLVIYGQRYFERSVSTTPEVVRQVTGEIAKFNMPPDFQPVMSADIKIPFTGQPIMKWVVYQDPASKSVLTLAGLAQAFGSDQGQMEVQLEQSLRQQGIMPEPMAPGSRKVQEKSIQVHGQPVPFTFTEGKGQNSGKPRLEVKGTFSSDGNTVLLKMWVDADKYNEAAVTKLIESIQ